MIVRIGKPRQWFEYPGTAIPPEITRLTGITDADVAGARINEEEAMVLINSATVAIAHNAAFDAPRMERRLPGIAGRAWACSITDTGLPSMFGRLSTCLGASCLMAKRPS
jgi:DNA polymerase-3 subunit epsilon